MPNHSNNPSTGVMTAHVARRAISPPVMASTVNAMYPTQHTTMTTAMSAATIFDSLSEADSSTGRLS